MASYIIKSKGINLENKLANKIIIGKFYSGDRFYTLLNEYIDKNLQRKSLLMAFIIKILFKSGNFKHDPGIANGQPWFVKLYDWISIICLILFIFSTLGVLGTLIPVIVGFVSTKIDQKSLEALLSSLVGLGIPALVFGIPAILWLVIYFSIRKKNKPLTLQAYVEKKISWCLKLRFLIKNTKLFHHEDDKDFYILEDFESQGAQGVRWLNIQLINLVCSIFVDFDYIFKFESLTNDELKELEMIFAHDFKKIELVEESKINWKNISEIKNIKQ